MYVIRVRDEDGLLGVSFSGHVAPEEALRAVNQAFALAEAGGIDRCICDLRELKYGPGSLVVLGAALAAHIGPEHRIALVCDRRQLSLSRRLARAGGFDERLGTFSREADATDWLQTAFQHRLGSTALRHFQQQSPVAVEAQASYRSVATG